MEIVSDIRIKRTATSRLSMVNWNELEFGKYVSDHMFISNYSGGAWQDQEILPFQNLSLSPVTLALHYGQSIFEGMKAFRMEDGRINIFRIEKHYERLNSSLHRMCMPPVPFELFSEALQQLVQLDKDWVPAAEGSALYLRPFVFASEAKFGVKIADEYKLVIVTGPVPTLYQKPIRVKVERTYIRAAQGGTGYAKCAGNYGGAFYPTQKAREEGFDQVIWTDASQHAFVEESGTMNLMFVLDGKLVTPPLSDSILDGITRDSLLQIAQDLGIATEERRVSITEIIQGIERGTLLEAFGAGTAAVVAPICEMGIDDKRYSLPSVGESSLSQRLKKQLENIRTGRKEDKWGWNTVL